MSFPLSKISEILAKHTALEASVKLSYEHLRPWIEHSTIPFFPEYTDHKWNHIQEVIISSSGLVADSSWDAFTSSDAAVLYMAVLLHDSAMHLSESGFLELIQNNSPGIEVGDKPWRTVWSEFMAAAKHYDGKKLTAIFGSTRPVQDIPSDPDDFSKRDRLLIGEFIRKNHHRIAQEFVHHPIYSGVSNSLDIRQFWTANPHILQIAGLVARSHGDTLRAHIQFLETKYDRKEYKNVHAVYLMVLLRISDYLQLHQERAPGQVLSVKKFSSPFSLEEWKLHEAIVDIRSTHDDPEAIFLDIDPKTSKIFLKSKSLISSIQNELDQSWAVLGEIYGRIPGLNNLGIVIRRIRSSLDHITAENSTFDFIPRAASFQSSDSDLLKLLVEPLYGNRPEVGVRELLQNSLDAVRERIRIENPSHSIFDNELFSKKHKISLSIEKDSDGFEVFRLADEGIGMTADTIVDYFLRAGASFRRSDDWRENFVNETGNSQVLRAGRFGIGALAAFLIGPEIRVITRHINSTHGIEFCASVDDDQIELWKRDCPVGTTITIKITSASSVKLRSYGESWPRQPAAHTWDWHCHEFPVVARSLDGKTLKQSVTIPKYIPSGDTKWKKVDCLGYEEIIFSFEKNLPLLICNGILVSKSSSYNSHKLIGENGFETPCVSILDPNGLIPLNLQRDKLTSDSFPFEDKLLDRIIKDFLENSLNAEIVFSGILDLKIFKGPISYAGSKRTSRGTKPSLDWYLSNEGIGYFCSDIINFRNFVRVKFLRPSAEDDFLKIELPSGSCAIMAEADGTQTSLKNSIRSIIDLVHKRSGSSFYSYSFDQSSELQKSNWRGACFYLTNSSYRLIEQEKLPKYVIRKISVYKKLEEGVILSTGKVPATAIEEWEKSFSDKSNFKLAQRSIAGELFRDIADITVDGTASVTSQIWKEMIGNQEIPFDSGARKLLKDTILAKITPPL